MAVHLQLSTKDRDLIEELRNAGVLQDVKEHLLDQRNGAIIVTCPDGDQFPDIFQYQVRIQAGHRADPRIHPLSWHGGAIACAPCSPVNSIKRADQVFMAQISDARIIKDINLVGLYAHAPCGAAYAKSLDVDRVLALQLRTKDKVKKMNHGVQAACFLHVDHGNRKRTYFVSRERWEAWARKHHVQMIA